MSPVSELVRRISRPALRHAAAESMRRVAHDEFLRGFRQKSDPYGVSWAPRKRPTGTWPLLDKTGKSIMTVFSRANARLVVLRYNRIFNFHQYGTRKMVARRLVPLVLLGLGNWRAPLHHAAQTAIVAAVSRG